MAKRNTIQRQLVIAAVRFLANHPTAEEVYDRITMEYPDISKGTVYRNLNSLVESGLLSKVSVPSGADRFDHISSNHCHVKCEVCGRVFDVDMDFVSGLESGIRDAHGFDFSGYDIIFHGICPECKEQKGSGKE